MNYLDKVAKSATRLTTKALRKTGLVETIRDTKFEALEAEFKGWDEEARKIYKDTQHYGDIIQAIGVAANMLAEDVVHGYKPFEAFSADPAAELNPVKPSFIGAGAKFLESQKSVEASGRRIMLDQMSLKVTKPLLAYIARMDKVKENIKKRAAIVLDVEKSRTLLHRQEQKEHQNSGKVAAARSEAERLEKAYEAISAAVNTELQTLLNNRFKFLDIVVEGTMGCMADFFEDCSSATLPMRQFLSAPESGREHISMGMPQAPPSPHASLIAPLSASLKAHTKPGSAAKKASPVTKVNPLHRSSVKRAHKESHHDKGRPRLEDHSKLSSSGQVAVELGKQATDLKKHDASPEDGEKRVDSSLSVADRYSYAAPAPARVAPKAGPVKPEKSKPAVHRNSSRSALPPPPKIVHSPSGHQIAPPPIVKPVASVTNVPHSKPAAKVPVEVEPKAPPAAKAPEALVVPRVVKKSPEVVVAPPVKMDPVVVPPPAAKPAEIPAAVASPPVKKEAVKPSIDEPVEVASGDPVVAEAPMPAAEADPPAPHKESPSYDDIDPNMPAWQRDLLIRKRKKEAAASPALAKVEPSPTAAPAKASAGAELTFQERLKLFQQKK